MAQEGVVAWYRLNPATACNNGGTTGNTASQLQLEYQPSDLLQDRVFFAAVLGSDASVSVSIGGGAVSASWTVKPDGGVGVYYGSAATGGRTGQVVVTVTRDGSQVAQMSGESITTGCRSGFSNFNAWVGSNWGKGITPVSPPKNTAQTKCTKGFGAFEFSELCQWTCKYGYCPEGACTCLCK